MSLEHEKYSRMRRLIGGYMSMMAHIVNITALLVCAVRIPCDSSDLRMRACPNKYTASTIPITKNGIMIIVRKLSKKSY